MKKEKSPAALLFQAVTVSHEALFKPIEIIMQKEYGLFLQKSQIFNFSSVSTYYDREMGHHCLKRFYFFKRTILLEYIHRYKLESQRLETEWSVDGKRRINMDPGFLTLYQFCLLTTKGFSHRPYLAEGIYCDLTLMADGSGFKSLPWTYPDYKTTETLRFMRQAKKYLKNDLNN